jgi:hypothetical protein
VLQLGGSDPDNLAEAARIAEGFGYDEVNINTEHKTPLRITSRGVLFLAELGIKQTCNSRPNRIR